MTMKLKKGVCIVPVCRLFFLPVTEIKPTHPKAHISHKKTREKLLFSRVFLFARLYVT